MPYGKNWRDLLLPPHHPGEGVTDERWERVFGSTLPKGKVAEEHECKGCRRFDGHGCVFGTKKHTDRCEEVRDIGAGWVRRYNDLHIKT